MENSKLSASTTSSISSKTLLHHRQEDQQTSQKYHRIAPKTLIQRNESGEGAIIQPNININLTSSVVGKGMKTTAKLMPLAQNNQNIQLNTNSSSSLAGSNIAHGGVKIMNKRPKLTAIKGSGSSRLNDSQLKNNSSSSEVGNQQSNLKKLSKREFIGSNHNTNINSNLLISPFQSSKYNEKREIPIVSTTDLLQNKKKLSDEKFILEMSDQQNSGEEGGDENIRQITKLSLVGLDLFVFETDLNLQNLQHLNLANNCIVNVFGIAKVGDSLRSLDLRNNFVSEIFPLQKMSELKKLILINNRVTNIKCVKHMPQLQFLDLTQNCLQVFSETISALSEVSALQELFLKDNPCTANRYSYKYDLLWNLKLVKLDGEVLSEKDYKLSRDFNCVHSQQRPFDENNNNNNDLNGSECNSQLQQQQQVRPSTSHGRVSIQKLKFQTGDDCGSLRVKELEKRIQQLEENQENQQHAINEHLLEKENLIQDNENCYVEIEELQEKVYFIEEQNEQLVSEAEFAQQLKEENLDLRRKITSYESTLIFKDADKEELGQQIYYLNKQLEDSAHQLRQKEEENRKLQIKLQELMQQQQIQ